MKVGKGFSLINEASKK